MKKVKLRRVRGVYHRLKVEHCGMTLDARLEDAFNRASDPGRERIAKVDQSSLEKEILGHFWVICTEKA